MADTVVYLYAVGDVELAESSASSLPAGVGGASVRFVVADNLAAAVSSVDAVQFSEEALKRSFEDLHWLEDTARAHHAVVDALAERHPVAPLRLATIYLADDKVAALLGEQAPSLSSALERVRGRAEWGVKAFAAPRSDAPDTSPASASAGPGASYLLRRRAERDRAQLGQTQARDAAERAYGRLAELAVASRRYPPQDARLTGYQAEMVLNAAFLVDDAGATELTREISEWDTAVLRLELTGPWAPYSFATLDEP
jgi:Gas vesicle synthesis protein GvpL/GvpF